MPQSTGEIEEALRNIIIAWDALPEGNHKPWVIENWLKENMWPRIKEARKVLGEKK